MVLVSGIQQSESVIHVYMSILLESFPIWTFTEYCIEFLSLLITCLYIVGFPCGSAGKESTCNVGDLGLISGLGRSSGERKSYPLQYSGLENSMDYIVHRVTKSQTRLTFTFHFLIYSKWQPTPALLSGKSHGWRSLVGCSPWGRKESDMTERLHFHFSLSCVGEGNGNPLQCSCLENPGDSGAWWAAVSGIAQSQIRLKRLSSSSSSSSVYITVPVFQFTTHPPHLLPGNHKFVFYISSCF